jgi:long-subunit acyl-CoA synthetase (AMP-forming)
MKIEHCNNLLELFYNQFKQERSDQVFLQSLKSPNQKFTWEQTYLNILKLSDQLESLIQNNDRCLLISGK